MLKKLSDMYAGAFDIVSVSGVNFIPRGVLRLSSEQELEGIFI